MLPPMEHIDLHTHSTASDGTLSPTELVQHAKQEGLAAVALTDHDTTDGLAEALVEGKTLGLRVVPGLELSVDHPAAGSLHVLAYFVDPAHPELNERLEKLRNARLIRNRKIHAKLEELGVPIDWAQLETLAAADDPEKSQVIGRPHFATALRQAGHVETNQEAFDKFLARGLPAYFDRDRLGPAEAIALIHVAGGLAVWAHPGIHGLALDALEAQLAEFTGLGLDGIEIHYPRHRPQLIKRLLQLAEEHGLAVTGGSDFHGEAKPDVPMGKPAVALELLDSLRAKLAS
jgi:predicted metal-dependent phosphoesterase TrpH